MAEMLVELRNGSFFVVEGEVGELRRLRIKGARRTTIIPRRRLVSNGPEGEEPGDALD